MKKKLPTIFITTFLYCAFTFSTVKAQESEPIQWNFTSVSVNTAEAKLIFTANLDDGWHIYSQFLEEGGPMPTTFTFEPDPSYELKGDVIEESLPVKTFDDVFMMDITWFNKTAIFTQAVKLNSPATTIRGKVDFMVCNDEMCMPPNAVDFSLEVKAKARDK